MSVLPKLDKLLALAADERGNHNERSTAALAAVKIIVEKKLVISETVQEKATKPAKAIKVPEKKQRRKSSSIYVSWRRLPDGDWGVSTNEELGQGDEVTAVRQNGEESRVRIVSFVDEMDIRGKPLFFYSVERV